MDPSVPPHPIDFDTFEHSKENIAPTPRGRSAIALAKAFQPVVRSSPQDVRDNHDAIRAQFEKDIAASTDLDDPLEVWLKYIKWADEAYPQGQSTESGISRLLERCTEKFKNEKQYKSDPRYLRVWLAYSTYSDAPLDIFVFLQRNEVGQNLALYYEEYAAVLEKMNRKRKADEVFQMGLKREARPVDRLKRRYDEFKQRLQADPPDPNEPSTPPQPLRTVLGATQIAAPIAGVPRPRKIQVFTDTEEPCSGPGNAGWESIGTLADRKKENSIAPKPWAGEKLPMRGNSTTPSERLVVFRDEAQPKRTHEHVAVNLESIYVGSEEFSFEELLAKRRGLCGLKFEVDKPVQNIFGSTPLMLSANLRSPQDQCIGRRSPTHSKTITKSPPKESSQKSHDEKENDIVYMPIRDEDSSPRKPLKKRPSPTINTKAALDDIIDIFSQPLKSQQELDQQDSSSDDESDATSLTSRSYGNQSDAEYQSESEERVPAQQPAEDDPGQPIDGISALEVSDNKTTTFPLIKEANNKSPSGPCSDAQTSVQEGTTPHQGYDLPAPLLPSQPQPQQQMGPVRRGNLTLMTPIEEHTESSIFQHSQDESSILHSPLISQFQKPHTPRRPLDFASSNLDSSPFEEYIPKSRSNIVDKVKRPALQPKRRIEQNKPEAKTAGPIIKELQCNPMDPGIHQQIFDSIHPAIDLYEGYANSQSQDYKQLAEIERFITKMSRKEGGVTQTLEMRITLGGTEYLIHYKLGQGAYASVFLAEAVDSGVLRAIKVEKNPPRKWEFYLMRQAKRRLGVSRAGASMVNAIGLHLFRDESYLILEYRDQGSILDLVNSAKMLPIGESSTGVMDEMLVMFLTTELLRTVEALHSKSILHGDLKADNCLVRFDEGELTDSYRRDGSCGWSNKGIALIDFGRGIDMKLFPEKVRFITDWETDEQDCPEMREMRPWTYQVDYWGLAGIIHSMLYGKYITTRTEPVGMGKKRYLLKESLKRYWQQDLWRGLLEVLLNPGLVAAEEGGLPITHKLRECREKMERWLEDNSERGVGLRGIIRRIESERRAGR